MEKIDITDTDTIQILLNQAKEDKNVAADLIKAYRNQMYKEAMLYVDDENTARDVVVKAMRQAFVKLNETDAQNLSAWLNGLVQEECMDAILPLETAKSSPYTEEDEIPDLSLELPEDHSKISNNLAAALKYLTPSERLVSVLKYRDQYSHKEIADLCNDSEKNISNIITQAKNTLVNNNVNLGAVFAMVNELYPQAKEKEVLVLPSAKPTREMTEEEKFNTAVQELKDFFETKTMPVNHITDRDINDEDQNPEEIERTFEMKAIKSMKNGDVNDTASSAKMIIAAAMSADSDEKVSEKEYNPVVYWIKRILFILLMIVLIAAISTIIRSTKRILLIQ